MKKQLLIGTLLLLSSLLPAQAKHYDPQSADFMILDRIEQKISDAVEAGRLDPEKFVDAVEGLLSKKKYSDRVETLLGQLIEDINYSYGLGEVDEFAMTAEDCYDDEKFDAQTQVCVPLERNGRYNDSQDWGDDYIDEDYNERRSWDDYSGEEDSYDDQYDNQYDNQNDSQYDDQYDDQSGSQYDDQYDDGSLSQGGDLQSSDPEQQVPNDASYNIQDDTISLVAGKKDASHEKIWNMFTTLVPTAYRAELKNYFIYTDKNDGNIAAVNLNPENGNVWELTVNKAFFYDAQGNFDVKENIHTLVHEFAHLLTLGKQQVDYIPTDIQSDAAIERLAAKCTTTFVSEGCLKQNAYLEKFIKNFWSKKDIDITENQQGDVYAGNESKFVSDYAATDTAEDMAESFTYFVIKAKPTGNTVADQKVKFFYQYDELVALREMIRKRVEDITAAQ